MTGMFLKSSHAFHSNYKQIAFNHLVKKTRKKLHNYRIWLLLKHPSHHFSLYSGPGDPLHFVFASG